MFVVMVHLKKDRNAEGVLMSSAISCKLCEKRKRGDSISVGRRYEDNSELWDAIFFEAMVRRATGGQFGVRRLWVGKREQ